MNIVESKIVSISSIQENDWNPNEMRDSVFQFLKKSIKKRGFVQPIIITKDGVIIDGAHRYRAAKELGAAEVEVKVLDISSEEAKAETVNFNLTKGTFDIGRLGELLLELDETWGKELLKENLVMEQKQIDAAIRAHQNTEDLPKENLLPPSDTQSPQSTIKPGDIFQLGNHRLMCGDSTSSDDVEELTGGKYINVTITDPPYNVNYKYKGHADNLSDEEYTFFIHEYVNNALKVSPFLIVTPGNRNEKYYYNQFNILGSAFWYKGFALTPGPISRVMVTEPILFIGEKPKNKMLDTDHLEYHTDREVGLLEEHSCPKPIGLFKELLTTFTDVGDNCLDLFGGSGTLLVAAEALGRNCFMMENDPTYCQSIINRARQLNIGVVKL